MQPKHWTYPKLRTPRPPSDWHVRVCERVAFTLSKCAGKTVLHLGCADAPYTEMKLGAGSLLHTQIMQYATAAYGLDIARTSIELLQAQGIPNLFVGDVESFDPSQAGTGFDLIVAGEIIEHLSNPGQFLNAVTQHMGERTELILTTPNAYCLVRSAIYAVLGRDPVHPDHNYWYSRATLTSLLSKHGLVVTEFLFYPINGKLAGYTVPWYMSLTDWLAKHWLPHLNDGLIAVCRKAQVDSSSPLPGGAGQ